MVHGVSRCFFCDEKISEDSNDHCKTPLHILRVHQAFADRERFDQVVRACRPSQEENDLKVQCLEQIKAALRPNSVHPTGSVGKETSLRGEHDIDVAVVVPDGPTDAFMDRASNALRQYGFCNVTVQKRKDFGRRLITATKQDLSLDILPVQDLDDDGWAKEAAKSAMFFSQKLPAWKKDVVRILKALLRLKLPDVPGILLEACVFQAEMPSTQAIRNGTFAVLERLVQLRACCCPCTGRDLMQDERVWNTRAELRDYCLELLALRQRPEADLGRSCQQSLPCCHLVTVTTAHCSYSLHMSLDHNVAKLMLSLEVHFDNPKDRDHVTEASQHDESYMLQFWLQEQARRQAFARLLQEETDDTPYARQTEVDEVVERNEPWSACERCIAFVIFVYFFILWYNEHFPRLSQ